MGACTASGKIIVNTSDRNQPSNAMRKSFRLLILLLALCGYSNAQHCDVPDTLFTDDTIVVCSGTTYQLDAPVVPGGSYSWSTTETTSSITIPVSGAYWLTVTAGACSRTDTVTVLFNSFLLSPLVPDLKLCKGQPATPFTPVGQQIQWYTDPIGGTGSPGVPIPSTADTGTTIYWFTQTIRGCESPRIPVNVTVIDKPFFELGEAFIIPCESSITLQVVPDGESEYTWSNGSHAISMIVRERGTYQLYAENMCGNFRDTTRAIECQDNCVQFPTAFTPNGDGKNDSFGASYFCPINKFRLQVFNRNGEMVFQTTDPSKRWDGNFRSKTQPAGAFVFYAEFDDFILKKPFTQKGTFVLIR